MSMLAAMNISYMATWDNLDDYIATLMHHSYLATMDMLHESFEQNDTAVLKAVPAEQRLQASVSRARVAGWLAASLLLTMTGPIVKWWHSQDRKGFIVGTWTSEGR